MIWRYPQSGSSSTLFLARSNWNLEVLVFKERGKTGVPGEKPLGAKERTNKKLNPHKASTPGFDPGPHWWKESALTTATSFAPQGCK